MSPFRGVFVAALCAAPLFVPRGEARAGMVDLTYSAPGAAGTVRTFITDLAGDTVNVTTNINAKWTATQKRDAILASLNAAPKPAGWNYVAKGADGITYSQTGKFSLVVNSNPRGTREALDRIVVPGVNNGSFRGGHGTMDPHSPSFSLGNGDGTPASFTAGIQIGTHDYLTTIFGNDAIFHGATTATGAAIATDLYNQLSTMTIPGVTLSLVAGDTRGYSGDLAITADFVPGAVDEGIIFGTTSPVVGGTANDFGFNGTLALSAVPEPASVLMLSLGMLGVGFVARRKHVRAS